MNIINDIPTESQTEKVLETIHRIVFTIKSLEMKLAHVRQTSLSVNKQIKFFGQSFFAFDAGTILIWSGSVRTISGLPL
jgi:hypothetical protein